MITLYQPPQAFEMINISPFCSKLETFFRMAKLEYRVEPVSTKTFSAAPNGKVPWIEVDGKHLPDSSLIIDYLQTTRGVNLTDGYSKQDHAIALSAQRILEEHLYWGIGYFRWAEDEQWHKTVLSLIKPNMPFKGIIGQFMKKTILKQMKMHGIARHRADTILAICHDDLDAIAVQLGDKPFYLGDKPTLIDCTVFGFLEGIVRDPSTSRLKGIAKSYANIENYCERMGNLYFPEIYSTS